MGIQKPLSWSAFSIHNKLIDWHGHKSRIELSFDITDFKNKVQTLENKIESILESIPGGICQLADDGQMTILWNNETFLRIIGYTQEQFETELNGTADYILPQDMAMVAAALEKRSGRIRPSFLKCASGGATEKSAPY